MKDTRPYPSRVFIDTNINCNLKCIQCDIHLLKNPPGELSLEDRKDIIRQIGEWDKRIKVLFSGGEPFLRKKELYVLAEECKSYGLHLSINTNGTLIRDTDLEIIPHSGIRSVVFSIDSHLPEVHDRIRGIKGTFERVCNATRNLAVANRRLRGKCAILITSILGSHNLDSIPEMVDLVEELNADGIIFQPIQPNFEREVPEKWWEQTELWPQDKEQVQKGIETLLDLKQQRKRIFQTPSQIRDMERFFLHPGQGTNGQCISMHENLMVDMFGDVRLCFNMDRLDYRPCGNLRNTPLRAIWMQSRDLAGKMQNCTLECGTMLCHSR